jgi:putative ABC transport system permease protein
VGEIGTMRAIGATRGEVRKMILWETLLISFIFGTIGIAAGGIILLVLSLMGIEVQNEFFRIIFGGSVIKPVISIQAVMTALITVLGIGTISSLYPVSLALKIKPVTAMQKD